MVGSNHTLQLVLEEHADVFKDELGKQQGVRAKIYVEEGPVQGSRSPNLSLSPSARRWRKNSTDSRHLVLW